jgi:hypothetical protein
MSVRAKFYVQAVSPSIEESPEAVSRVVNLGAVCRGATNREWASATPSGSLTMTVRNDAATAQFKVGTEYYVTFEEAEPKPVPNDGHEAKPGMTSWNAMTCEVCGLAASWGRDSETGLSAWLWDEAAQARHDEAYGAA